MNESFHPFFQFDESAVVGNGNDFPGYLGIDGIAFFQAFPGVRLKLFVADGHSFAHRVDVGDDDGDFFIEGNDF